MKTKNITSVIIPQGANHKAKRIDFTPLQNYIKAIQIKTKLASVNILKLQQKEAKCYKRYIKNTVRHRPSHARANINQAAGLRTRIQNIEQCKAAVKKSTHLRQ